MPSEAAHYFRAARRFRFAAVDAKEAILFRAPDDAHVPALGPSPHFYAAALR